MISGTDIDTEVLLLWLNFWLFYKHSSQWLFIWITILKNIFFRRWCSQRVYSVDLNPNTKFYLLKKKEKKKRSNTASLFLKENWINILVYECVDWQTNNAPYDPNLKTKLQLAFSYKRCVWAEWGNWKGDHMTLMLYTTVSKFFFFSYYGHCNL